ncbi:hypothetical protein QN277_011864 [Acacia crassicarpa]|uniref:CCHC-type domain-containing protein n=1 Tax=Acacia crassicarpa TaxID=499986 RepID=A0AAE1N0A7_9FABA|nr:hypothetical protein QN277_011864 [Acacia crassicarpa]
MKELWEEQSALIPIPSCQCNTSKIYAEVIQQQKLLQFLTGLNKTYDVAKSQILITSPLPSVKQAFAMISEDEAQKNIAHSAKEVHIEGVTVAARGNGQGRGRGKGNTGLKCVHCGRKGHEKEGCWHLIGFPPEFKANRTRLNSQASIWNAASTNATRDNEGA